MESSCEDTKVIQVTENGCLGEGGSSGVSEKHLSSTYILKVESTEFTEGIHVGVRGRKKELEMIYPKHVEVLCCTNCAVP